MRLYSCKRVDVKIDLIREYADGWLHLDGLRYREVLFVILEDGPFALMVLQCRAMLDPVSGIQIGDLPVLRFHYLLLRLMDMAADNIIILFFNGKFGGDEFEVVDLADGLIDLRHNPF